MKLDMVSAKVVAPLVLFVRFRDGVEGEMQFQPSFFRGVFSHLIDPMAFEDVRKLGG